MARITLANTNFFIFTFPFFVCLSVLNKPSCFKSDNLRLSKSVSRDHSINKLLTLLFLYNSLILIGCLRQLTELGNAYYTIMSGNFSIRPVFCDQICRFFVPEYGECCGCRECRDRRGRKKGRCVAKIAQISPGAPDLSIYPNNFSLNSGPGE